MKNNKKPKEVVKDNKNIQVLQIRRKLVWYGTTKIIVTQVSAEFYKVTRVVTTIHIKLVK